VRIGLVLGGGGYAGTAFHAGVLSALAGAGWDARDAEVIVGTSAGAASGILVRAGFPPAEYPSLLAGAPLSAEAAAVLEGVGQVGPAPRPGIPRPRPASAAIIGRWWAGRGAVRPGVLRAALLPAGRVPVERVSPGIGTRFRQWPLEPTWLTAVDLDRGQRAVFGLTHEASVTEAVSASVAIPGYFAPVVIQGVAYVDGGAWSTHHADLLATAEVDAVIVSAPSATPDPAGLDAPNLLRLPLRRQLVREVSALRAAGKRVLVISPDRSVRRAMGLKTLSLQRRPVIAYATWLMTRRLLEEGAGARVWG